MTPQAWVAMAYGIVAATLGLYTVRLRRRLRRQEAADRPPAGSSEHLVRVR